MIEFIEKPANARSLSLRRLVYGVGVNDADYLIEMVIGGKRLMCPFYRAWTNMLNRCYSVKYQAIYPTYADCSVCSEWLVFSNFKGWMKKQDWGGKHLDKDILSQGNKIYSPKYCLLVTSAINGLFNNTRASRGKYPQGVSFNKESGKFQANCKVNGKDKFIGRYLSPKEASEVYKAFKYNLIAEVATTQDEPLKSALLRFVI